LLEIPQELLQPGSSGESAVRHLSGNVAGKPRDADRDVERMRWFVREGGNEPVKFELRNGKKLEVRASPIPEVGAVCTIADITISELSEERMRQSHKLDALGELAGGVAHEYNNLLTSILGFARRALKKPGDEDRVREALQSITEASGRASEITQQMLTFSHKQVLAPTVVDIGETIRDMETLLRIFVQANIEISFDIRTHAHANVDPALLTQCISNLVTNSRQAMSDGGKITISCDATALTAPLATSHGDRLTPGRYVRIAVADTGGGIEPEVLAQIFDPFFTTREIGKGTGLGLSVVFGMVKNQGGAVGVESTPGAGTTFTIYLPEVEAPSPGVAAAAEEAKALTEANEANEANEAAEPAGERAATQPGVPPETQGDSASVTEDPAKDDAKDDMEIMRFL
jgi:signal transduction histidine kinase